MIDRCTDMAKIYVDPSQDFKGSHATIQTWMSLTENRVADDLKVLNPPSDVEERNYDSYKRIDRKIRIKIGQNYPLNDNSKLQKMIIPKIP